MYGDYDVPKPLRINTNLGPNVEVQSIFYTDTPNLTVPGWKVRYVPMAGSLTNNMKAKWWKLNPFDACPDTDISCWVDAAVTVTNPNYLQYCLDCIGSDDWSLMRHAERDCVYAEATFTAKVGRAYPDAMRLQSEHYRHLGHPERWGLFASTTNVRRHTDEVAAVCCDWWFECTRWSHQDQVSLPVVIRNSDLKWNTNLKWATGWGHTDHKVFLPI